MRALITGTANIAMGLFTFALAAVSCVGLILLVLLNAWLDTEAT